MFALVDWDIDVMEARKRILDKLGATDEVQDILKVHVNKFESFLNVDDLRWNSVDIFVKSKEDAKAWEEKSFRKNIFFKVLPVGKL